MMNLIHTDPWELMNGLDREMDRWLVSPGAARRPIARRWVPAVDVREERERFVLQADLPGVRADDIDITLANGVLTIEGKRELTAADDGEEFHRVERVRGTFKRQFKLPEQTADEGLTADYRDGVLTISVPRKAKAEPHRIEIKAH